MCHSVNMRAFAHTPHASLCMGRIPFSWYGAKLGKCAAPCLECKCSHANAHSWHLFAARDSSTNHNAGASANVIPGIAGGTSAHAERREPCCRVPLFRQWQVRHCSIRASLTLVHTWPLLLGQCICLVTCLKPSSTTECEELAMQRQEL